MNYIHPTRPEEYIVTNLSDNLYMIKHPIRVPGDRRGMIVSEEDLIRFGFKPEEEQEDRIDKVCYDLEPDLNLGYDYLINKEALRSINKTASMCRDRIKQAILKHLPK